MNPERVLQHTQGFALGIEHLSKILQPTTLMSFASKACHLQTACKIAPSSADLENISRPGSGSQPCITHRGKIHYLGKFAHFQVEADDKDVPGDPEHQPDCILWVKKTHTHNKHSIQTTPDFHT